MFEGTSHEIAKQKEALTKMRAYRAETVSEAAPPPSNDLVDAIARLSTLRDRLTGALNVAESIADTLEGGSPADGAERLPDPIPMAFIPNVQSEFDMLGIVDHLMAQYMRIQKAVGT